MIRVHEESELHKAVSVKDEQMNTTGVHVTCPEMKVLLLANIMERHGLKLTRFKLL